MKPPHFSKQRLIQEFKRFACYAFILTLFFSAFTLYRRLVLRAYDIDYIHYEYGFVESLVLAKIIMVGQMLNLGDRFDSRPLAVTTLYKTIVFSFFVLLFSIVEYFVGDFFRNVTLVESYRTLLESGLDEILAKILVMFFFFVFFFAFLELGRVFGSHKLFELFFKRRRK